MSASRIETAKNIGACVHCGIAVDEDHDHFFPRMLLGPKGDTGVRNELKKIVYNPYNKFPLCEEIHDEIDRGKYWHFLQIGSIKDGRELNHLIHSPSRGDPVALLRFLQDEYPITNDPRYYNLQVEAMIKNLDVFIKTVRELNGSLDPELKLRYKASLEPASDFKTYLKNRPIPLSLRSFQIPYDLAVSLT